MLWANFARNETFRMFTVLKSTMKNHLLFTQYSAGYQRQKTGIYVTIHKLRTVRLYSYSRNEKANLEVTIEY